MRTKLYMIALAAMTMILGSCSDSNSEFSQDYLADTPIKLNVSVDEPTTRAGYSSTVLPEEFWLTVIQDHKEFYSKYNYIQVNVKKEGDSWKTYKPDEETGNITNEEVTMLWANMNNTAYIYAGSKQIKDDYVSTTEDQSTENNFKETDFLIMPQTSVKPSTDGISVNFKHAMSKINLTIELGSEYEFSKEDVEKKITDVKIDGSAEKAKCLGTDNKYGFDFKFHSWKNPQTITPLNTGATPFSKDANGVITKATATYEAILIPQDIASGKFTVSFKVDGKLYEWAYNQELTLVPTTAYTLKLTAGDDKVQPVSFSVAPWGKGNGDGEKKETD